MFMGSTIESAICFSLVLSILTIFIVFPVETWNTCGDIAVDLYEELSFHMDNSNPVSVKDFDDFYSTDTSPEVMNTAIAGILDSVNIAKR